MKNLNSEVRAVVDLAPHPDDDTWDEPQPLPNDLLPVEPFEPEMLPEAIREWVTDVSDRMQCPPDFPAVGAMVALSSVLGTKVGIGPKRRDDWLVIPNLWGAIVGRPGVMKSPALSETMKPLDRLAIKANEAYNQAMTEHAAKVKIAEMSASANEGKAKKLVEKGKHEEAERMLLDQTCDDKIPAPVCRRYKATDATVEALGEILIGNPFGVLAYRDELSGLLRSLDKEGQDGARAFYLQAYDGNQSYTFDRIGRGLNKHIPTVCLSVLGGIQPGKIQSYIHAAISGGSGDDGLLQRFGLLVYPDVQGPWIHVDRYPDTEAKNRAFKVFEYFDAIVPSFGEDGKPAPTVYRFAPDAQDVFDDWRSDLEEKLRAGTLHPAVESHLAKYRKLIPAIALVCAMADKELSVSLSSLMRALAWGEYLESHAMRLYGFGLNPSITSAKALISKIRTKAVKDAFKPADVYLKSWSSLSTPKETQEAINLLCDLQYLRRNEQPITERGGRPSVLYMINPKFLRTA